MIIKLLVDGGEMKPGPTIAQKLGPMGINIGMVIQDINKSTSDFKGLKVPVELTINKNKTFSVKVLSPPTSELLKKELGLEKASGEAAKIKVSNAGIEQVISVAKIKYPNMLANNFTSAVKNIVGSCVSAGILIENKNAKEIEKDIDAGIYNKEIEQVKTQISDEKKKQLKEYFDRLKMKQDEIIKKEEEAKAAAEAEKVAKAAAGAATPAAGKTPAAAEKKEEPKKK